MGDERECRRETEGGGEIKWRIERMERRESVEERENEEERKNGEER